MLHTGAILMKKPKKKDSNPSQAKMDADTSTANSLISEQLKVYTSTDAVSDFLAGVAAGFLSGHKLPLEPFIEKMKKMLLAFEGAAEECEELLDAIREGTKVDETKH
jgi:hypothetical protein